MDFAKMRQRTEVAFRAVGLPPSPCGKKISVLYSVPFRDSGVTPVAVTLVPIFIQGTITGAQYAPELGKSAQLMLTVDLPMIHIVDKGTPSHSVERLFFDEKWSMLCVAPSWSSCQLPVEIDVEW